MTFVEFMILVVLIGAATKVIGGRLWKISKIAGERFDELREMVSSLRGIVEQIEERGRKQYTAYGSCACCGVPERLEGTSPEKLYCPACLRKMGEGMSIDDILEEFRVSETPEADRLEGK